MGTEFPNDAEYNSHIVAREQGDKRKTPALKEYRYLTFDEVKNLSGHALFITRQGTIGRVKITTVKTWKTRPDNVEVHIKYGLYEYGTIEYVDGKLSGGVRLVVEVVE